MKPPPLLLGATLLFWGWQTGFLLPGALMAVILEAPAITKTRWDFSDDDFGRIWTFCSLLLLAAVVYAFTANDGISEFRGFMEHPGSFVRRNAGVATARTAASIIRWVPMMFFLFIAAQQYSAREGIPLETISLILRARWKKARKLGRPTPPTRTVNVAYAYFAVCIFSASVRGVADNSFFWGLCVLLAWALWGHRSRRFALPIWMAALLAAFTLGYLGQRSAEGLRHYLEGLNPQWLFGMGQGRFDVRQSKTQLGQLGRLKASASIAVRLEVPAGFSPPPRLREASYRSYKGESWFAALPRNDVQSVTESVTDRGTFTLLTRKTNTVSVNIACSLPGGSGLLPLPHGSSELRNLAAYLLNRNPLGAVIADGPGLVVFDAFYGPGETIDSSATDEDLVVPEREKPALDHVIDELGLTNQTRGQAMRMLNQFFLEKFSYSTWQRPPRRPTPDESPLSRFLLTTRSGHCEYFATATVLLLRELGFHARYAVGYAVHEASSGRKYVVRQRDAHSWCLVWNEHAGLWQDFDTTPASWLEAEASRASGLQFLKDAWSRVVFEFSKFRWGQSRVREDILWSLIPILGLLLYQIISRARRQRRKAGAEASAPALNRPGLDSEFYALEKLLLQRGRPRERGEPLSEWLLRATADPALADFRAPLFELLQLHYRHRFDPLGLAPSERVALKTQARACLERIARRPLAA